MKRLQRVTREATDGHSLLYLYYPEGAKIAKTIDVVEGASLTVDFDLSGETVGVELIDPGPPELQALAKVALDRDLSLEGLFSVS